MTKPLGVGAITTAHKRGSATPEELEAAVETMVELNARAGRAALGAGAHAATDVTGFGLLGHLHNLARESGLAAELRAGDLPILPGALAHLEDEGGISGGGRRNREYAAAFTRFGDGVPEARRALACDPVTSGGLLIAVAPERAGEIRGGVIGRLLEGSAGHISLI